MNICNGAYTSSILTRLTYVQETERNMKYLILHFLNVPAVKHIEIFIAAYAVALHLIFILIFVLYLKEEMYDFIYVVCIYKT